MVFAIGLQERHRASRARRIVAAIACSWLVLAGVLGARHESTVAHVVDQRTGEVRHASALVGVHTGDRSDYHASSDADSGTDVCAISAALHQAARCTHATAAVIAAPRLELRAPISLAALATITTTVYRLAPKTSPPVRG
ncbi:MAG TPA: hypothetical protein VH143_25045 [Kofleriaceae bacterium]|jgi:hypothetical protein|nr:hypothetical protein [Kofleriaceae bacterium]